MEMTGTGSNPFAAIDRARIIRMAAQVAACRSAAEVKAEISYGDRRHQGYLKPRRTHTTGPAKGSPPFARGRLVARPYAAALWRAISAWYSANSSANALATLGRFFIRS